MKLKNMYNLVSILTSLLIVSAFVFGNFEGAVVIALIFITADVNKIRFHLEEQ